jgi:hypothetical protein
VTRAECQPTDCLMQENFFVQVLGEKRWLLAAPAAFGEMYVLPGGHPSGRQSALDWPHVNTSAYPRATGKSARVDTAGVGLLETWLKPKEVLYCPPVWFHSTEAVGPGPNLGLSFWSESGEQRAQCSAALPYWLDQHVRVCRRRDTNSTERAPLRGSQWMSSRSEDTIFGRQAQAGADARWYYCYCAGFTKGDRF